MFKPLRRIGCEEGGEECPQLGLGGQVVLALVAAAAPVLVQVAVRKLFPELMAGHEEEGGDEGDA